MDRLQIEETLRPETVNEVLLLNRIRQLQRALWESGTDPHLLIRDPNDAVMEVPSLPPTLMLHKAVSVEVEEDKLPDKLRVRAQALVAPTSFEMAYYIPKLELANLRPRAAANMLGDLHQTVIRQLAQYLENGQ